MHYTWRGGIKDMFVEALLGALMGLGVYLWIFH